MRAKNKEKSNILSKIIIIAMFIGLIAIVINLAPNYIKAKSSREISVIINQNDVTESLKFDAFIEDDIIYISTKDIANFFDEDIFYDNVYDQIITTSDTKVATLGLNKKEIYVNSSKVKILGSAVKKDNNFYLPFSEIKDVYNVDVVYNKDSKIITIDSLNKEMKKGNASNDIGIKYKPTIFSKTLDNVKKGDNLVVIEELQSGWKKVRTSKGYIGYTKDVTNVYTLRENLESKTQIDGKVSLVWDYFSEYASAPDRTGTKIDGINVVSPAFLSLKKLGQGELNVNIGTAGLKYIEWAHNNGYKVWPILSNNSYQDTTSEILNDYNLRETLINKIVNIVIEYNLDGINLDFEYLKGEDKDVYTRFIIELAPRLKEYGKVLSVDVTAPDGSENWSLCYNRNKIAKNADYIIFMAYDEYGTSSTSAGTTAGADWVEVNIKKFLGQEEVSKDKLILGMPFYTRLWKETGDTVKSSVVSIKNIDSVIPASAKKEWNEDLKQYYAEYQEGNTTCKIWLEEEESIKAKFALMKQYNLAGAAYWAKDMEPSSLWNLIAQEVK